MRPCKESGCTDKARSSGMCKMHYSRWYRAQQKLAQQRQAEIDAAYRASSACDHLDCTETADLRFTWPPPVVRQERACHWHGRELMGSFIRGLTVEHI